MRILVHTHFFYPEAGAGSIRMQYFVETLRNCKNEIRIISPRPNYPSSKPYPGHEKFYQKNESAGIHYLPIYIPKNHSLIKRGLSYLSYFISSFIFTSLWRFNPDLVITSSPPISTALAAACFSRLNRKKMILDLRDIWPDIGIELGLINRNYSIQALKKIETFILNSAESIIVTAEGDKTNLVKKGVSQDSISIIFNGADTALFKPLEESEKNKIRTEHEIPLDKKVLIYFGSYNYGMNDLDILSEALVKLKKYNNEFYFIAAGDGDNRESFISKISQSVDYKYMGALNINSLSKILASSDISLIPRKGLKQDTGGNTPVKCFESWAAGVPVILSANPDSEISKIFSENQAGILTEPDNADSFMIAIQSLLKRNDLKKIGLSGRKYVEINFNRKIEAKKLEKIITKLNDHIAH